MKLSLAFTGFSGLEATMPAIGAAEEAGLDGVWVAEHIGFHDGIVHSTMILRETKKLSVGIVGLSSAGRHPAITAMELMSLSEIAPGRVRAAVGSGDPGLVGSIGKAVTKPLLNSRALIESLREVMKGSNMMTVYPEWAFRGFRATPWGPPVPIDLMAIRPKMVALAAEVANGLSISVGASRQYIRETIASVEEQLKANGRDRKDFHINAISVCVVTNDKEKAIKQLRALMGMGQPEIVAYLARGVFDEEQMMAAAGKGPMALMNLWTEQAISDVAVFCSPEELPQILKEYADTGVDELSLLLAGNIDSHVGVVQQLAAARP